MSKELALIATLILAILSLALLLAVTVRLEQTDALQYFQTLKQALQP